MSIVPQGTLSLPVASLLRYITKRHTWRGFRCAALYSWFVAEVNKIGVLKYQLLLLTLCRQLATDSIHPPPNTHSHTHVHSLSLSLSLSLSHTPRTHTHTHTRTHARTHARTHTHTHNVLKCQLRLLCFLCVVAKADGCCILARSQDLYLASAEESLYK